MKLCPNGYIKNPVRVRMIDGKYQGQTGWADEKPNENGMVRFCGDNGIPFHFNTFQKYTMRISDKE